MLDTRPPNAPPSPHDLLVIACDPAAPGTAQVFLAEREEQTEQERLFLADGLAVRVPRDAAVAVRPVLRDVRIPAQHGCSDGERALLEAVSAARSTPPTSPGGPLMPEQQRRIPVLAEQLRAALVRGDAVTSRALALALRHERSLPEVYELLRCALEDVGVGWEQGRTTVLAEHRTTAAATAVVEALRTTAAVTPRTPGTVVLACPTGDRHQLGLLVLADLLEQAGHVPLVAGDLPAGELLDLAARTETRALVLSAHNRVSAESTGRFVEAVRQCAPHVKVALGGPGFPRGPGVLRRCRPDLLSSDVTELLALLDKADGSALTARESQVLGAVADGLTNAEIGQRLGIAPATVKSHLDNVLVKTGTEHRAAAVARALRAGWIR
jgi:DNA-binding CsgD family transcriptional regulator/methanogenic corrinoid protein MtbC1